VEVYFPSVGWVPFDASARRAASGDAGLPLSMSALRRRVQQALDRIWAATVVIGGVLTLLSALLGPGMLWRWLLRRLQPRGPRAGLGEVYEWFRRRAAAMAGIRPERWRTPAEMRDALLASGLADSEAIARALDDFTENFYARRYGPREPTEGNIRRMASQARRLLAMMRRSRGRKRGRRS
ncbi:MAG: DUF4129 domain-containing protein, partial [Armatimonadetes bacterium]|nr:DUF4129 domain-containing protein [Armatimonadota bacterium]